MPLCTDVADCNNASNIKPISCAVLVLRLCGVTPLHSCRNCFTHPLRACIPLSMISVACPLTLPQGNSFFNLKSYPRILNRYGVSSSPSACRSVYKPQIGALLFSYRYKIWRASKYVLPRNSNIAYKSVRMHNF